MSSLACSDHLVIVVLVQQLNTTVLPVVMVDIGVSITAIGSPSKTEQLILQDTNTQAITHRRVPSKALSGWTPSTSTCRGRKSQGC